MQRCTTLDDLLRLLARYFRLITSSFFLHYRRSREGGEFIWRPAAAMSPWTLRSIEELFAVSFHVQISSALQQRIKRYDIYLSIPSPRHAARYRNLRPARFHFGQSALPQVRVAIDRGLLDASLIWVDAEKHHGVADLGILQRSIYRPSRWSEWVVMMLREAEGTQPALKELAALLSVSPRTLTRYLANEGVALRDLANKVRYQRACKMLLETTQSIAEIAWRLGYGDATNFSHAFRAAAGISPRTYRARTQPA
jgi:AraC-like DNA-binding protein